MPPKKPYYQTEEYVPLNVSVDLGKKKTGTVGANMSSRIPLSYVNESGKTIKGFFTANESLNDLEIFRNRAERYLKDPVFEQYRPLVDALEKHIGKAGIQDAVRAWYNAFGVKLTGEFGFMDSKVEDEVRKFRADSSKPKDKIIKLLADNGAGRELAESVKDDPAFNAFLTGVMRAGFAAAKSVAIRLTYRQGRDININKRNNAFYDYSQELELGDLVCRSTNMTLRRNGVATEGSFMVNSVGTDSEKLDPRTEGMNARPVVVTGAAVQSTSCLQIMDTLCGNADRNPGNIFLRFDKSDPKAVKLVGVQGIDNDGAFGVIEYRGRGTSAYMSRLEDIKVIDDKLADTLLKGDYSRIENKLRLAGLSQAEIKAARERRDALCERIRSGKITRIRSMEEWDRLARPEFLEKLRFADENSNSYNIFDNVMYACESYNQNVKAYRKKPAAYNKSHPLENTSVQMTEGRSVTVEEGLNLRTHRGELEHKRKLMYMSGGAVLGNHNAEFNALYSALSDSLKELDKCAGVLTGGRHMLSDTERNDLFGKLRKTADLSAAFLTKYDPPAKGTRNFDMLEADCHIVKELGVYLDFAMGSIERDALEAFNAGLRAEAENIRRQQNAGRPGLFEERKRREPAPGSAVSDISLDQLQGRLAGVDKSYIRSSDQFKDLRTALEQFSLSKIEDKLYPKGKDGKPSEKPDPGHMMDGQLLYRRLIDSAKAYLEYKIPEGDERGLSAYARDRVRFAKDVLKFAEAGKQRIDNAVQDELAEQEHQIADQNDLRSMRADLRKLAEDFKSAGLDAAKVSDAGAELRSKLKNHLAEDLRKLINISAGNPNDHPVQKDCGSILQSEDFGSVLKQTGLILGVEGAAALPDKGFVFGHNICGKIFEALGLSKDEIYAVDRLGEKAELAALRGYADTFREIVRQTTDPSMDDSERSLVERRFLDKGFKTIGEVLNSLLEISEKYPREHPMQMHLGKFLDSKPMYKITKLAGDIYSEHHKNGAGLNLYAQFGIDLRKLEALAYIREKASDASLSRERSAGRITQKP